MTTPDPVGELVALLKADAAVTALAGTRVFSGGIPANGRGEMPQATVVLTPAGGPGRRGYNRYRRTRVDTTCYGATLKQSWQLHLAVRELLEGLHRNGSIFWAQVTSDGANALDPAEQWPTCYASYSVLSADEA